MEIELSQTDGTTVLGLRGDLDASAADELERTIAALAERGRSRLVVDLSGVPYVDSRGLSVLVAGMRRARAAGGDLRLCAPQQEVLSILGITHLIKILPVFATRPEALASW